MTAAERKELEMKVGLLFVEGLPAAAVRRFDGMDVDLEAVYANTPKKELNAMLGLRDAVVEPYQCGEALARARREVDFMERHNIRALYLHDADYPSRLLDTATPPVMLFVLGEADLSAGHSIAMVGTRKATAYGIGFCERFVEDLGGYFPDLCVVSGLAYGIDAASHTAAVRHGLATVGVLAHGLDMIYPAAHRELARTIIAKGGALVSEYPSGTRPLRGRFLERNRIVACMPQAVMVVESEIKGGAMSTANNAFSYSRDVFALPGRSTDTSSAGCNHLIRRNKAALATCAADVIEALGWRPLGVRVTPEARNLFPELEGEVKAVYDLVRFARSPMGMDEIHTLSGIPVSRLMSLLGEMEFDGLVSRLPGNRFEAIG